MSFISESGKNSVRTSVVLVFFSVSYGGVRLSPLGTSATNWATVRARMIHYDCGAVGRMRIGGGNRSTGENLPQYHFVHHKSHMTSPGIEPWPPWCEAGD
jgi:hypothetical protein